MKGAGRLPLGVDLGASRIRIAVLEHDASVPFLRSVIVREQSIIRDDFRSLGESLAKLLREEHIVERRAVLAVGEPDASIYGVTFPPMTSRERESAARYEALRFIDYPLTEASVQIQELDAATGAYVLGIARENVLQYRLDALRTAGLRVVGVDHEAFAYRRVFRYTDAVLDIGHKIGRLYVYGGRTPFGVALESGAQTFTTAISQSLDISPIAAEQRKRTFGLAGAARNTLQIFARSVGQALLAASSHGAQDVLRIVLVGNGARLSGLAESIERVTGSSVAVATEIGIPHSQYGDDVVRAGVTDWALSVGIGLWSLNEPDKR